MATDSRPRVLIVEDEPDLNNLLADVLSAYDFTPMQALDGDQAFRLMAEHTPSAILLDLMLPGLSGFEICRQLKSSRATRTIPILILTALDRQVNRRSGFDAGADDYLTKPFTPDGLIERLQAALERARLAAETCGRLTETLELAASLDELKAFNTLATGLFCCTDFGPDRIEALRQGLARISDAAGLWATRHGGAPPVRLTMDLDADRLRLTFAAAAGAEAFLTEYLDADAAVPAMLTDAGVIDRILPAGDRVVIEKLLHPPVEA